ncbi:MAG: FHA domain-containing protein [Chthoniobacterales bacterium]
MRSSVSGRHAKLDLIGEHHYLHDLDSTDGTRVTGETVTKVFCARALGFVSVKWKRAMSRMRRQKRGRSRKSA